MRPQMKMLPITALVLILASVAIPLRAANAGILLAAVDTSSMQRDDGFGNLVTNLRKNPVTVADLLSKAKAAPAAPSPQTTAAHLPVVARTRTASSGQANTVTTYTDSFFSSKVSPY